MTGLELAIIIGLAVALVGGIAGLRINAKRTLATKQPNRLPPQKDDPSAVASLSKTPSSQEEAKREGRQAGKDRLSADGRIGEKPLPSQGKAVPQHQTEAKAQIKDATSGDIGAQEPEESTQKEAAPPAPSLQQNKKALREQRLKQGLKKTRSGFVARIGKLLAKKQLDESMMDELEELLFTADIGPKTAQRIFSAIADSLSKKQLLDQQAVWKQLADTSMELLHSDGPAVDFAEKKPFVLLVIGVNGAGKTTTIGKLAAQLSSEGKSVILAAGDTFRAAAVEQLQEWGARSKVPVVRGKPGSDPSSVIFDAITQAKQQDIDVVIADTAGRLHTKVDLMDELGKITRVCDKALPGAPHQTWLVLDATTGQNAIQQAEIFQKTAPISGIVLTKLDGTAKGGVILGICDQMKVPVRYIGIGEGIDDLQPFDAQEFISALYELEIAARAA